MEFFGQEQLYNFVYDIFIFIIVIIFTAVVVKISKSLISRIMSSGNPYVVARIKQYVTIVIWSIGIILGIKQVGISTDILTLIMALAGIGFIVGASHVLQNIVSRSFLNLQMQYKVGDIISIGNSKGKIIEFTDLNVVLLDDGGNLVSVPNVLFLKEIWIKHRLSGYEITIPVVIKTALDVVNFEKELLNSLKEHEKYFKKEPNIVTSKTDEKTTELCLILNLKDPEKKSVVTVEVKEIIDKLIEELTRKAELDRKDAEIKEIKDISR